MFIVPDGGDTARPDVDAVDMKLTRPIRAEPQPRQLGKLNGRNADLFFHFANEGLIECLASFDVSADDIPAVGIGRTMQSASSEQ